MKIVKLFCLDCNSALSKSKSDELLTCKKKSCKKTYKPDEYKLLLNEQKIEDSLNRELDRLIDNEQFITDSPSKYFEIGDVVNSTYGQSMMVVQKERDKFYLIADSKNQKRWIRWHDLYLASTKISTTMFNKRSENINKRVQFSNRRLDGILHYFYSCKLNMNPEYQRGFVWKEEHKLKLIDSIFNGIEIGKMVFVRLPWKENSYLYEILDGKQRLSTIIEFIEDRFTYNGYYFSQLHERDKSEFLNALIAVGETDEGFSYNDKIRYFLSVNDTGVPQDPSLIELLKEKLK